MFRGDDYQHNYRDSFLEGALVGGLFSLCIIFVWRCRWVLALLAAGFWLSYHTSGEASRNDLIAAKFDEKLAKLVTLQLDVDRHTNFESNRLRSVAAVVSNATPATMTKFIVSCQFYMASYDNVDSNTRHVYYKGYVKGGNRSIAPGETKTLELLTGPGEAEDLAKMDRSSLECHLFAREFDKHEQLRSIAKK